MKWDSVEKKWKQLIGSAKENWNKLTEQDLEQISGKREPLISKSQESYGITRREADKQVGTGARAWSEPERQLHKKAATKSLSSTPIDCFSFATPTNSEQTRYIGGCQ